MPDWSKAECYGADVEQFFPQGQGSHELYKTARRLCMRCEIREACLEWALENNETQGMWGGHTPRDRQRLLRMVRV